MHVLPATGVAKSLSVAAGSQAGRQDPDGSSSSSNGRASYSSDSSSDNDYESYSGGNSNSNGNGNNSYRHGTSSANSNGSAVANRQPVVEVLEPSDDAAPSRHGSVQSTARMLSTYPDMVAERTAMPGAPSLRQTVLQAMHRQTQ